MHGMSLNNRLLIFAMFCIFLPVAGSGQFYGTSIWDNLQVEAGLTLGGMNAVSDIMGNKHEYQGPFAGVTLRKTKFTGGLYGNAVMDDKYGLRMELNYGRVEGHDSLNIDAVAPSAYGRYERNLNFRSNIYEASLLGEIYFTNLFNSGEPAKTLPYALAGFSIFGFNPQALVGSEWIDLRPLRLEGQGFAEYPDRKLYRRYSWSYPIGVGVLFNLSPTFNIRAELLKRTTFTDYLDDVHEPNWVDPSLFYNYLPADQAILATQLYNRSYIINPPRNTRPRGNPKENDAYWSATIKIGYKFNQSIGGFSGGRLNRRSMLRSVRCFYW